MNKKLTVGILAHVDAGKTTLSEAMLYKTGEIRKLGRVDHGDSFLDDNDLERNRGITIFSKQAMMTYGNTDFVILDTPGHVDFSAEMERTLAVLDYALLIISAVDGVQSHTETVWRLLQRRGIPTFIFVNKMDLSVRGKEGVMEELLEHLDPRVVDFSQPHEGEEFLDAMTMTDEGLMESVLENGALTDREIAGAVQNCSVYPVVFGAALKMEGTEELLDSLDRYTLGSYEEAGKQGFGAKVFKIARDRTGSRVTFLKLTSGRLRVKEELTGISNDGTEWHEKVDQIRLYSGARHTMQEEVSAGMVCGVTGLSHTRPGDLLGTEHREEGPENAVDPFLSYTVVPEAGIDSHRLLSDMRTLEEEDPKLHVALEPQSDKVSIRLMGQVQLEILTSLIRDRFGYEVRFESGHLMYKETIKNTVEGVGHFEPLRHYAEVHLLLEPGERGSGLVFDSIVPEDELDRNWQRLIMTHLEEREPRGVLTNSPLTDVRITIGAGRAHAKHTEGGDFRQATYRAIRQGLMKAESELLEPWFEFRMELPAAQIGRAMTDVQKGGGRFNEPESRGETAILTGHAPAALLMDYQQQITSYTSGQGRLFCSLSGYEHCHNTEEVVAARGYDAARDMNDPADSVFCSHGSSDIIPWDQVEEHMHLPSGLKEDRQEAEDSRKNAMAYGRTLASDAELMAIFEKTYGPVRRTPGKRGARPGERHFSELPEVRKDPETAKKDAARNEEIRAKKKRKTEFAAEAENHIIVDGYNLINADPELTDLAHKNFGSAREQLLDMLCNYRGYAQCEMTVVFDAYKVRLGTGSEQDYHGVRVVFTKANETADVYIGKLVRSLPKDTVCKVVSSDGLVQQNILGQSSLRVSSQEFLLNMKATAEAIRELLESM